MKDVGASCAGAAGSNLAVVEMGKRQDDAGRAVFDPAAIGVRR